MKRIISALICTVMVLSVIALMPQNASAASISRLDIRIDDPVASYSPDFSAEFNTNSYMYSGVSWYENSPGFSSKLNSSDEFRPGIAYKVSIWIMIGDGNYLPTDGNGDLATSLTINGKVISSLKIEERNSQNQITAVTVTYEYGPLSGMEISSALIKGIPTPLEGNMPIYSFTINSNAYSFYHTEPVVWWDMTTGKQLDSGDTFIKGHKYQLNIWLSANRHNGYTFRLDSKGNPNVNVILNSWAADSVTTAYEQDPREVIDIRYTFPACQAAHTCAPKLVPQQDPTCLLSGFKAYYECNCGKYFEDAAGKKEITDMDGYGIIAALGHKEGDWAYNGTHHYKKCTRCLQVIPGTNAAHGGGKATCVAKGKCSTCGYAYLPENENHTPDTKWTACAGLYHAKLCKLCGAHCTPEEHKAGAAATETSPQTCKVCGYIMAPAKNHTHKLTKVAAKKATCLEAGNTEYYTCSGCSDWFQDAAGKKQIKDQKSVIVAPLGHTVSDDWKYDDACHWRTCTTCGVVMDETKMSHELTEGACGTCSFAQGSEVEPSVPEQTQPVEQTQPSEQTETSEQTEVSEQTGPDTQQPTDSAENGFGIGTGGSLDTVYLGVILLVVLICIGAAVAVVVIVLNKKK